MHTRFLLETSGKAATWKIKKEMWG